MNEVTKKTPLHLIPQYQYKSIGQEEHSMDMKQGIMCYLLPEEVD